MRLNSKTTVYIYNNKKRYDYRFSIDVVDYNVQRNPQTIIFVGQNIRDNSISSNHFEGHSRSVKLLV